MVETSSPRDAFARRPAPAADRFGAGNDHFRQKTARGGGDRFASGGGPTFDPTRPKQDAFAAKVAVKGKAAKAPVTSAPARATALTTAPVAEAPKRTPLHVVASQAEAQPTADELMFGRDQQVQADGRLRRSAKSSSFVLMTGGAATAASTDTIDAPPPAPAEPPPPPKAAPAPLITNTPKRSGGGGDGGDGGDYYGSGAAATAPPRKRGIDQDDIAGIIFGLAVIIFLLLWLFRGRGDEQRADIDPLLSTQFAATDTGPPPPFTPQPDPFGDMPVDLKPTGPIPDPLPEATPPPADGAAPQEGSFSTAQVNPSAPPPAAAPALPVERTPPATPPPAAVAALPGTPLVLSKLSSNAWFCTGSSDLTEGARADLLKSVDAFKPHAKEPMVVHAYADTRGTSVYNLALSGERARVVADFLRSNGLEVIETEGKGELDGLADDQNCANQRRADIFFKSGSELRPSAACMPPPEASASICR
jgi:outer membrane protein OmpA-like peptidoglycan-associated protein